MGQLPAPVQTAMDLGMPAAPSPAPTAAPAGPSRRETNKEMTLKFLRAIADHELSGGAPIGAVMFALGATKEQGVGSKAAVANRVLDEAGFVFPDVYSNPRDVHGDRYWKRDIRLTVPSSAESGSVA